MWKVLALVLVAVVLSGCASGPPADPNKICRILADERGWKKMPAKPISAGGCHLMLVLLLSTVSLLLMRRQSPSEKSCSALCPWHVLLPHLAMLRRSMKRGLITKRVLGDVSLDEMIWAMRWILLAGTTTPVTAVLGYPRATPIDFISPITAVTVVMLEVHGRSLLRSRATQKKPLDRLPFTTGSSKSAEFRAERVF